jgi:hypothetical protein
VQALGPEHDDPSSLACMQAMRATGEANWQAFVHPDVQPLPRGHLMNYPNSVADDGSLRPLPDCEEFPDLVRLLLLLLLLLEAASSAPNVQVFAGVICAPVQAGSECYEVAVACVGWTA